jgi:hypothetical protein
MIQVIPEFPTSEITRRDLQAALLRPPELTQEAKRQKERRNASLYLLIQGGTK